MTEITHDRQGQAIHVNLSITIYAPVIYTAPCIIFWMRAYPLRGEVEGGWALEFESFLGPLHWHQADIASLPPTPHLPPPPPSRTY
jgi:hypothetical protein